MPINTIQCKQCGNRIHYSVDNSNVEQVLACNRCGTVNHTDISSISKYVAEEIKVMQEEHDKERKIQETTFKPSFEGEDGMPKSEWKPGTTFLSDSQEVDLDQKLDSVKQKFKKAQAELNDVGTAFQPSSTESLIDRFTVDDIDLSVHIPLEENGRSESPSFIKQKALEVVANKYLGGNISQANKIYDFILNLYHACKYQNLDFRTIVTNGDTVLRFAKDTSISPDTIQILENLYQSGDIDRIVSLLDKYLQ